MKTIRWGILSTAKIGIEKVIPAIQAAENCEVIALASRNQARAVEASLLLGIEKAYGTYAELLADQEVDAIYIPLPNSLHVDWAITAMESGKHVLCEKPLGLDGNDALRLLDATAKFKDVKVMEAFMYRFHPQWVKIKQLIESGEIGKLRTIHSFFSYFNDDPNNIRNMPSMGGGSIMDIGCYSISLSRYLFAEEPTRVVATVERDPTFGTDNICSAILEFETGTSTFTCSTSLSPFQRVVAYGTMGHIEIEIPFNAPPDKECRMWVTKGREFSTRSMLAAAMLTKRLLILYVPFLLYLG